MQVFDINKYFTNLIKLIVLKSIKSIMLFTSNTFFKIHELFYQQFLIY